VISVFEDLDAGSGAAHVVATPAERGLRRVLAEIDQTTRATLGSITIATMLRIVQSAA
jgi:hypothetical protein